MNVYNLKKDDIFQKNSTSDIDFYGPLNEYGIYDENNYKNVRPVLKENLEDYKIEQTKDDFNREILLQNKKEQSEIAKNMGEISIVRDPRITKYEDTYSITPYATFMITPLSQMDGEDIVSRFDRCYGEWITGHRHKCNADTEPCKKIKQHFIINNPDYTGEHCRDKEGRRLRDGDNRHVFCNHYQNRGERCSGKGKCIRNTIGTDGSNTCICDDGYNGPNCETYDCDKLINELKNIPNDIIQFFINDNHRGEEYKNIEDIIDTNTITGIHLNMSTLNFKENYDLILEHKILEKIFSCTNIIFIYLDAYTTTFILDHKEIFNNIMDKVKEYDKLKYVKLVINPGRDLVLIEFIIVISTKYYNNILLRELKSQNTIDGEEIYFANPIETPCIYIVPGISISDLQNNCKLIEKLHNDRNYNKHIPLEYFRDC